MTIQSKNEILAGLAQASRELLQFCSAVSTEQFFHQPAEKWSIAQNITHLTTSAKMTHLVYRLPKLMVRLYTGKPNRASRTYETLAEKYRLKLAQGGKASGRFVAKPADPRNGKPALLMAFGEQMENLHRTIAKRWTDPLLDSYLAPHPLLGKITLRELGFFTIYHTYHHLQIIRQRLEEQI